jgi:hypothetical protein
MPRMFSVVSFAAGRDSSKPVVQHVSPVVQQLPQNVAPISRTDVMNADAQDIPPRVPHLPPISTLRLRRPQR